MSALRSFVIHYLPTTVLPRVRTVSERISQLAFNLEPVYRRVAQWVVRICYKTHFSGVEHIPATGGGLLICNHIAYVDGLIINAAVTNRRIRYIIDRDIYNLPMIHHFMILNRAIPISPTKEDVTKALDLISAGLEQGDLICIFPEGQMTYTGNLGRFKPGIEWIISRTPVPVYPLALEGLWGSIFSRKYRKAKFRFLPRLIRPHVTLVCGAPIAPEEVKINYLQQIVMELREGIMDER